MALDGAFLTCLRRELTASLPDARIDKIHQPGREELVLVMRTSAGTRRLYLSAQQAAPRIHLTTDQPENPAQPPMFCMLLRKRLTGGRLLDIRQEGQERALSLSFDCLDELGDHVCLTLIVEIMGRNSNIILVGGDGRIIDAIRRVDPDGTARPVLPSFPYEKPPAPAGLPDTLRRPAQAVTEDVCTCDRALSKALLNEELGLSPLVCRELAFRTAGADDVPAASLDEAARDRLTAQIARVQDIVRTGEGAVPYLLLRPDGTALEFSFLPIAQYGLSARGQEMPSFSALLDAFYSRRSAAERMRARAHDLSRLIDTTAARLRRKLKNQREDLAATADRDRLRLFADLIYAGMGQIRPGADSAVLTDIYAEDGATVAVPLDPALSPSANAQRYYKEYRKAQTAEQILTQQIAAGEEELAYIESVADALSRAATSADLDALRQEMTEQGYLRARGGKTAKPGARAGSGSRPNKKPKPAPAGKPMRFLTDDGLTVLIGRNNLENDRLTLHTARGSDIWLHVKNSPGSHVVVLTEGQTPPDRSLEQAAVLAATYSKAAAGVQVPVDYTAVRFVKKPSGAKPGRVIYTDYRTAFVDPDPVLAVRLRQPD